jgi:hypothetical protein
MLWCSRVCHARYVCAGMPYVCIYARRTYVCRIHIAHHTDISYCGDLPTPLVDGHTSWVYYSNLYYMYLSINQCCRTSCCASFHSGDPDQIVPFVLYTVPPYFHTHTLASTGAVTFFASILQCTLHWLQLCKRFFRTWFRLKIYKLFVLFFLLEVGRSYHSTQFWTHSFSNSWFCQFFLRSFSTLRCHPTQPTVLVSGVYL